MKIAIHHSNNSYSERWIEYCKDNGIDYKIVNAYENDIIDQVKDCNIFMWHHHHANYKDALFAKQLLYSLQIAGKRIFPDFNTGWHFDDKVGQKYLLESIEAPLVPSYVFYSKNDALNWINKTIFPKVFKLRGGAGSSNVKLVRTKKQAIKFVSRAFGKGFSQFDRWNYLKEQFNKRELTKKSYLLILKGIVRLFITTEFAKMHAQEKGYVYFQDFIPNNNFDIRVIVIGNKAFAIKRLIRDHDFRASGSGKIIYNKEEIDIRCVELSFLINETIKAEAIAYDFIFDRENKPLIVEISYGFAVPAYDKCPGYWTKNLSWHEESFNPQKWMIENLINKSNNL